MTTPSIFIFSLSYLWYHDTYWMVCY